MTLKSFFLYAFVFYGFQISAQSQPNLKQQKIATSIADYFKLDRENIHLHLNKNLYLTNEVIWFKGYIIEKKHKPTIMTSNVYVRLLDTKGQEIFNQLYYAEEGIFDGHIKLDKSWKSGKYYLQVYTNFMNNFSENESSISEITILNASEKSYNISNKINPETLSISFFPESGILLEGISNTIGVRISDCNGEGLAISNIEVENNTGVTISTFSTDQFGYGKFDIYDMSREIYKATFNLEGRKIEKSLPMAVSNGVAFSVDNYMFPGKTILKVKTNRKTLALIKDLPYTFVFQQDEATTFADFTFKENAPEQQLTIASEELHDGINAVYLIDKDLKKIGERIIYKPYLQPSKIALNLAAVRKDSIVITGSAPLLSGTLSITVLPGRTSVSNPVKTIDADLQFDNYLVSPTKNTAYYLTDFTKKKHYELDNLLLSQQSKYSWEAMLGNAPQQIYPSDCGLTIKGTVNNSVKNSNEMMINMNSLGLGLNEFKHLNDKNEFLFEHILAQDSTKIYFVAIDKKERKPEVKIYSQLLNNNHLFTKQFVPAKTCTVNFSNSTISIPFPKVENSIILDSVSVAAKRNKLVNQNRLGNMISRGYKISDQERGLYLNVLNFIGHNGYSVSTLHGEVRILGSSSGKKNRGPEVFIDEMIVQNYDLLQNYTLDLIDEVYINKHNNGPATDGIIKIYTKKNFGISNNISNKSQFMLVKNGFQKFTPYQNPKYDNVGDEGFLKLGTIDWKPIVRTDENGSFQFSIANMYQKSITFVIEGLSPNGQTVSEIITIDIP